MGYSLRVKSVSTEMVVLTGGVLTPGLGGPQASTGPLGPHDAAPQSLSLSIIELRPDLS